MGHPFVVKKKKMEGVGGAGESKGGENLGQL